MTGTGPFERLRDAAGPLWAEFTGYRFVRGLGDATLPIPVLRQEHQDAWGARDGNVSPVDLVRYGLAITRPSHRRPLPTATGALDNPMRPNQRGAESERRAQRRGMRM